MSKGGKILIIEDESDVSTYLQTILTANGYESATCDSAACGMDMVRQFQPDLISLDIMMPQETGISFYVKLRQAKDIAFIPVIIISGAVQEKEFDLKSFVSDESIPPPEYYLEKPIDVDEFLSVIKKLLKAAKAKGG
jgi:DNA-binding response OmpR family regulator